MSLIGERKMVTKLVDELLSVEKRVLKEPDK